MRRIIWTCSLSLNREFPTPFFAQPSTHSLLTSARATHTLASHRSSSHARTRNTHTPTHGSKHAMGKTTRLPLLACFWLSVFLNKSFMLAYAFVSYAPPPPHHFLPHKSPPVTSPQSVVRMGTIATPAHLIVSVDVMRTWIDPAPRLLRLARQFKAESSPII